MTTGIRVRRDQRLDDEPMRSVECTRCGAVVAARKSSWDQTSVQWCGEAMARCEERRGPGNRPATGPEPEVFRGCSALKESVRAAAVTGELPVLDASPRDPGTARRARP